MIAPAQLYLFETFANNAPKGELRDTTVKASIEAFDQSWGLF